MPKKAATTKTMDESMSKQFMLYLCEFLVLINGVQKFNIEMYRNLIDAQLSAGKISCAK